MEPDGKIDRRQYQLTYGLSRRLGCQFSAKEVFRHRLRKIKGEDYARYQLIARAIYLPKGYLTKPRFRLRFGSQCSAVRRQWSAKWEGAKEQEAKRLKASKTAEPSGFQEKLYARQMLEMFVLRPELGIQSSRRRIDQRISHGQFVDVGQFRCRIGEQFVDGDLLEL